MAFSPAAFSDDTDFERFVLDLLGTHRVRPPEPSSTYDAREEGGRVTVKVGTAAMGTQAREALLESLRPLGFGAAYKVLDMLVEHVVRSNRAQGDTLDFKTKVKLVKRPNRLPVPLDTRPELWDRLTSLYACFKEARHAVTHRRAQVSGGDLAIYSNTGQHTDTVTSTEITSFAAAVHAVAELVINARDDNRRANIVGWHLNALQPRHRLPPVSATDPDAGRWILRMDVAALPGTRSPRGGRRPRVVRRYKAHDDPRPLDWAPARRASRPSLA